MAIYQKYYHKNITHRHSEGHCKVYVRINYANLSKLASYEIYAISSFVHYNA